MSVFRYGPMTLAESFEKIAALETEVRALRRRIRLARKVAVASTIDCNPCRDMAEILDLRRPLPKKGLKP